jgi:hypothetical protein
VQLDRQVKQVLTASRVIQDRQVQLEYPEHLEMLDQLVILVQQDQLVLMVLQDLQDCLVQLVQLVYQAVLVQLVNRDLLDTLEVQVSKVQ